MEEREIYHRCLMCTNAELSPSEKEIFSTEAASVRFIALHCLPSWDPELKLINDHLNGTLFAFIAFPLLLGGKKKKKTMKAQ